MHSHNTHAQITFLLPLQFYSDEGVPFYVNLPSAVISQCLMNASVTNILERYPTELETDDGPSKYDYTVDNQ